MNSSEIRIRAATIEDAAVLLDLIVMLATYEKLEPPSPAARERLVQDAFGPSPRIQVCLATLGGKAAGYAITFEAYSSFLALPTLFLEDIFVVPDFRRHGVGRALFHYLAGEAVRRGCGRMEWAVLEWNQLAITFYEGLGARRLSEWHTYRLDADQLKTLSKPTPEWSNS